MLKGVSTENAATQALDLLLMASFAVPALAVSTVESLRTRILIEASTESEWMARCLESLGHNLIVAHPNYAPQRATRSRPSRSSMRGPM